MGENTHDLPKTLFANLDHSRAQRGAGPVPDDLESACVECGESKNVRNLYWYKQSAFKCPECHPDVPDNAYVLTE